MQLLTDVWEVEARRPSSLRWSGRILMKWRPFILGPCRAVEVALWREAIAVGQKEICDHGKRRL